MKWIKTLCYGLLTALAFQFFLNMMGMQWSELMDIVSLLFVLAGLLFSLAHYPLSQVMGAFSQAAGLSEARDESELALSREILVIMGRYALLAGALGTLLGTVYSLANLDTVSQLGHGLAVSVLSLLYSLAINYILLYPLQTSIKHQELERSLS